MKIQSNYNPDVLSCLANLSSDEVFTPPKLANEILDLLPKEIWKDKNATFLDPVSKSGIFLREIARRLLEGLQDEIPNLQKRIDHIYNKQIFGIGITELTSLLSRRSLYCSKEANGKYSVLSSFDDNQGNIFFDTTKHDWKNGRCSYCGASQSEYEREQGLETHAYQFIHNNLPNKTKNMKFDVIIGNPPYQLSDHGHGSSAIPIYQKFVEQAKKLNPRFLTMIIPSRWLAGGKGLEDFRKDMLGDERILLITDYINAKECFPGVSLGGGACYFLWTRDSKADCNFTNILNGKKDTLVRKLNEFPIFVRYNKATNIIRKIKEKSEKSLSEMVDSRNPFGISSSIRGVKSSLKDGVTLYSSAGVSYVKRSIVTQSQNKVDRYKVMVSKVISEHAGEPDKNGQMKIVSTIRILKPGEVCTDSYLTIGEYKSIKEANNLLDYLKTKFARCLMMQAISSINLSRDKFYFVPMQDFSKPWTDEELYRKYKLTKEEIEFIESMIRPMN
ncbi:Eco57I restriction-modification methylase domain-containing protein [Patescibacteria group bacterium]|nr:Eco57I restriction-modification methylase domain-containing protein [Patescibacteria group bacterium]